MTEAWKERGRSWFLPLARGLAARGVTPDALTIAGFVFSLLSALLFAKGNFVPAAIVLGLTGLCDMLDGDVARLSNSSSRFGAFLDSTLDRAGEGAIFSGIACYYFARAQGAALWLEGDGSGARFGDPEGRSTAVLALATLILSFLVSYTRARAEGLGLECRVGIMERPERLLLLLLGAILGHQFMPGVLGILFLLTLVTVLQRVYHVRRLTRPTSAPHPQAIRERPHIHREGGPVPEPGEPGSPDTGGT
jgi:CDP-diacylglycerol--glycerol-3-phosphate 3-phosphatidyltransferase